MLAASIGEKIGHALDAVHQTSVQVCAQGDRVHCGAAADDLSQERQNQAEAEEKYQEGQGKLRVERGDEDRSE